LEALANRPYLRQIIFGLTVRWQQNNEPPPPPVQPEAESSSSWQRTAAAQEEDYFNGSDEDEDVIGPKLPSTASSATTNAGGAFTISPQKRKRSAQNGPPLKRPSAPSPGKMSTGNRTASSGGGLVDYDDASDSDGSSGAQSPVIKSKQSILPTSPSPSSGEDDVALSGGANEEERLEEDLGDVALKMRAKRAREEEEEEGFGGLLLSKKKEAAAGDSAINASSAALEHEETVKGEDKKEAVAGKKAGKKEEGGKKDEGGKKIRLSFGSLKKFGSGGK
jgi:protein phosphatase-4 regulatory subunit 3